MAHAAAWTVASAPFVAWGLARLARTLREQPESRLLLGASAGFTFVLSALKIPSITGSCSHPTGIGFGTVLFGAPLMVVLGFVVLIFQALLLAHGGLTTLGANTFSMAIVGSFMAAAVLRLAAWLQLPFNVGVFLAALCSDLATYCTTSLQLALAFPDAVGGVCGSLAKFLTIFALTQLPLAFCEGLLSVLVMNLLRAHATEQVLALVPKLRPLSR